jgi:predicted  nucleic acid-binding Zn-ribbon protein
VRATRRKEEAVSRALVAELFALQEIDQEIDRGRIEVDALRRALAEDATRPAREAAANGRRQAEQARQEAHSAEAALQDAELRIQRQEARLYGGATGQRDLGALQSELSHLKAAHAEQEERVLAVMLAAEEAETAAARAAEELSAAERDLERHKGELRVRLADTETAATSLRARRAAQAAVIDPEGLRRYEAIRATHGGRAVALVQGGTCQACRVVITSGALQRAKPGTELVPCPNCGRILYVR